MYEPSILDYLKARLMPWKYPAVVLPELETSAGEEQPASKNVPVNGADETEYPSIKQPAPAPEPRRAVAWPWRSLVAVLLAILAQKLLDPQPERAWLPGVLVYVLALLWTVWANLRAEWRLAAPPQPANEVEPLSIQLPGFVVGVLLALLAFVTSGGNRFSYFNVGFLLLSLLFLVKAFWLPSTRAKTPLLPRLKSFLAASQWHLSISPWTIVVLVSLCLAAYFRFINLSWTPPEMTSDHAENILDVLRLLNGDTLIYFPSVSSQQPLFIYAVAFFQNYLSFEAGFLTLKVVSALIGILALPFLYLIGKELGSRRIGLLAVLFAGVAYWPNVVSRLGLRLPLYIVFTAITFYLLLRSFRTQRRNDFILTGLALGLSFYGHSANWILVVLLVVALGLFILHTKSPVPRRQALWSGLLALLLAFIIYLPMLRYTIEHPEHGLGQGLAQFHSLPSPALSIFLRNLGRALSMFSWSNGEVWTSSIPLRPALETIPAALFWIGVCLVLVRYIRRRQWLDLFLCLAIPLLLLPSVLNLAIPAENPNLYRTGGALVVVFILVAATLDSLMTVLQEHLHGGRQDGGRQDGGRHSGGSFPGAWGTRVAWGVTAILLFFTALHSYNLVFDRYVEQYRSATWNNAEMGRVVRGYIDAFGNSEHVWVVGYPYWVDTRLVAMEAGIPERDLAFSIQNLPGLSADPLPKLFLLKPEDQAAQQALQNAYPQGWLQRHPSQSPGKDFLLYFVPAQ